MSDENDKRYTNMGIWIAFGAGIGTAIGAATQNIGMWLAIGVGMGVAIGAGTIMTKSGNGDN